MLNETSNFNMSISARYARKYGSKNPNPALNTNVGSHTSRVLNKNKKSSDFMTSTIEKSTIINPNDTNFAIGQVNNEKSTRNYRIKIKRPKSAFFTTHSSSAISKPGNSPSPTPVVRNRIDPTQQNMYANAINPYTYLKNSYKKSTGRHYFYTKEEMADYQDHVALNQMFMSKTCHNFIAANQSSTDKNHVISPKTSPPLSPSSKSNTQPKASKSNRYSSNKSNFLFNKPR